LFSTGENGTRKLEAAAPTDGCAFASNGFEIGFIVAGDGLLGGSWSGRDHWKPGVALKLTEDAIFARRVKT
jgi:hypothetical protein